MLRFIIVIMYVIHKPSNEKHLVLVQKLGDQDCKKITVKGVAFNWKKLKGVSEIFKLSLDDQVMDISPAEISIITDSVLPAVQEWRNRPLELFIPLFSWIVCFSK